MCGGVERGPGERDAGKNLTGLLLLPKQLRLKQINRLPQTRTDCEVCKPGSVWSQHQNLKKKITHCVPHHRLEVSQRRKTKAWKRLSWEFSASCPAWGGLTLGTGDAPGPCVTYFSDKGTFRHLRTSRLVQAFVQNHSCPVGGSPKDGAEEHHTSTYDFRILISHGSLGAHHLILFIVPSVIHERAVQ